MTTARERMLELTALPVGSTARLHFLSIDNVVGSTNTFVYGEIAVELVGDLEVELEGDFETELEGDLEVELEKDFEVEVCS